MPMVQSLMVLPVTVLLTYGRKGGFAVIIASRVLPLGLPASRLASPGCKANSRATWIVSAGGVPPTGVAAVKSIPQGVVSPAAPPVELTQLERISAIVLTVQYSGDAVPLLLLPGEVPVA